MARNKGLASFSANFEAQIAAPIDARMTIATKNDLYLTSTWQANDGLVYSYKGMIVSVNNDTTNNGVYTLIDEDYSFSSNWIMSQGTTGVQGITGLIGQTGVQGLTGLIGQTGFVGNTGVQGQTGIIGNTGVQGVTGIAGGGTGLQGQTGLQGVTGLQGSIGNTGAQGQTGSIGVFGLTTNYIPKAASSTTLANSVLYTDGTNIGVGTTTPLTQVEINGTSQLAGINDSSDKNGILSIFGGGSGNAGEGGAIIFGNSQTKGASALGFVGIKGQLINGGGKTTGNMVFCTRASIADTTLTERMRLTRDGNVGIGTTSPDALLSVWRGSDEVFAGTGYRVAKFSSTTEVNSDRPGIILGYDTTGGGIIAPATQSGTTNFLGFWTINGTWGERVRIAKDGNVGIGNTNPTSKLSVQGDGSFSGLVTATGGVFNSTSSSDHALSANFNGNALFLVSNEGTISAYGQTAISASYENTYAAIIKNTYNGTSDGLVVETSDAVTPSVTNTQLWKNNNKTIAYLDAKGRLSFNDETSYAVGHGVTTVLPTNTYGRIQKKEDAPIAGGLQLIGIGSSGDDAVIPGITLYGICDADIHPAILINGSKISGTGVTTIGDGSPILHISNNDSNKVEFLGNGTINTTGDLKAVGKFSCNNSTAQAAYAVGNACTDLATAITLINNIRTALLNNGIAKVS